MDALEFEGFYMSPFNPADYYLDLDDGILYTWIPANYMYKCFAEDFDDRGFCDKLSPITTGVFVLKGEYIDALDINGHEKRIVSYDPRWIMWGSFGRFMERMLQCGSSEARNKG